MHIKMSLYGIALKSVTDQSMAIIIYMCVCALLNTKDDHYLHFVLHNIHMHMHSCVQVTLLPTYPWLTATHTGRGWRNQ